MRHLLVAAEKGDANAQFNLGVLHDSRADDNGHAIASNRAEAVRWLLRAAEQGLARAQCKLAEVYGESPSGPTDRIEACVWFLIAARNSAGIFQQRARSGYERVAAGMTPAQIAKAERLAAAWRPKRDAGEAAPAVASAKSA